MKIPEHIAIIMDGNRRWAKKRGLPNYVGHMIGANSIENVAVHCNRLGVKFLTLYAFSTENWKRSVTEVNGLLKLINHYISKMKVYLKHGVKIKFFGDLTVFSEKMQKKIAKVEKLFNKNTGMTLAIALNYGGRSEIVKASKQIALNFKNNKFNLNDLNEQFFQKFLYSGNEFFSNVDLLIRTGPECRISNFLLWQIAYAELLFLSDVLWPDFRPKHIDFAIEQFNLRNRTYGQN